MAERPTKLLYPSTRSLRDLHGVRRQLVRLFIEGKAQLIEPPLLGRLVHCLNSLQALDNGRLLEQRIAEIERRLGSIHKANGRDDTEEARL